MAIGQIPSGVYPGMKVKIGLYYSDQALASANLQNVTGYGSGYRVGYYDTNCNFNHVAYIYNVEITMKPDLSYHIQMLE